MTKPAAVTPAQYAAAFLAAAQAVPASHQALLVDGFLQVLDVDGARSATREIISELTTRSQKHSARVARAEERPVVAAVFGDAAEVAVSAALIGGAVIRSGETEIDSSIAGQLRRLAQAMKN